MSNTPKKGELWNQGKIMGDYLECYNFFNECRAFALKHENFLAACKRIKDQNEKVDPQLLNTISELYAEIKREMESTCNEHKCIVDLYDCNIDMESDISDIAESVKLDSEKEDEVDDSDSDESEMEDNNSDKSEIEDNSKKINDESDDEEEGDYDDSLTELFQTYNCCIHELIDPFFQTMVETKQSEIIRRIQKLNDEYEQECLRFDEWFNSHEKDECALLMKDILFECNRQGTKYIKVCESKCIKLLATFCKDKIDSQEGKTMFGKNYEKIIDAEFPLNKKRKIFSKEKNMLELLSHIAVESMPEINEYLVERQKNIILKMKST